MRTFALLTSFLLSVFGIPSQARVQGMDSTFDVEMAFGKSRIVITLDNIPESYWIDPGSPGSMLVNCFIIDKTNILTQNIISSMSIYDRLGASWSIEPEISRLRIGSWENSFTTNYSRNGSVLLLGEYTIEIETLSGKQYWRTINLTDFNSTINPESAFIYSSDYEGLKDGTYFRTISRPTITSAKISGDTIAVDFTVNDDRVRNGFIEFYDINKKYIGETEYFYNGFSKQYALILNDGTSLYLDSRSNVLEIKERDLDIETGRKFSEIGNAVITVYDLEKPGFNSVDTSLVRLSAKSEMTPVQKK